jgi:cell division protein FtsL
MPVRRTSRAQESEGGLISFVGRHVRGLLCITLMVLVVHDIFGTHGFLAMRRTQSEIGRVQADLERLNKENVQLEQQVKDLKTDPRTIEKIAREDLVLAKPGEIIIKIPQDAAPVAAAKSKP